MAKHLTGQKNQCPSCKEYFNSNVAFEKHRVGTYNPVKPPYAPRHCRTPDEMLFQGMSQNQGGWWITKQNPLWAHHV
jgi:hypothetical protein